MSIRRALILGLLLAGCASGARWHPPTEEQMASVKPGMSRAEVEKVLGSPPDGGTEHRSGEEIAAWRVYDGQTEKTVYFQVHYRVGVVARTTRAQLFEARP